MAEFSKLDNFTQSIAGFKLDRISQLAVAENNVTVANNQLADSNNGLVNFYTTSDGSLKDLEVQIQQTNLDLLSAQADLDSAGRNAQIQTSAKDLEIMTLNNQVLLAQNSLQNNQVASSINGVLSELAVDEGDYVSPGTYIGKIIQRDKVKIVFYLSEINAKRIQLGQEFNFTLSEGEPEIFVGTVSKIAPSVDPINKKVRVEGTIDNNDFELKPETFINLSIDLSERTFDTNKVYIPMNSVIFGQNEQHVYVAEDELRLEPNSLLKQAFQTWLDPLKDHQIAPNFNQLILNPGSEFVIGGDIAIRKNIEIGRTFDTWVEVVEGLSLEDKVIVEGQRNLPPRGDVRVNIIQ